MYYLPKTARADKNPGEIMTGTSNSGIIVYYLWQISNLFLLAYEPVLKNVYMTIKTVEIPYRRKMVMARKKKEKDILDQILDTVELYPSR
ncbi:MAG: hypothetical protein FWC03_11275 [Treponema sp.]|nr:hypothetical protein [Treponema sp.]